MASRCVGGGGWLATWRATCLAQGQRTKEPSMECTIQRGTGRRMKRRRRRVQLRCRLLSEDLERAQSRRASTSSSGGAVEITLLSTGWAAGASYFAVGDFLPTTRMYIARVM